MLQKNNFAEGKVFELDEKDNYCMLGTHKDCHIRIKSEDLPLMHALVLQRDNLVFLQGIDRHQPVLHFRSEKKLYQEEEVEIESGDVFCLGERHFCIKYGPSELHLHSDESDENEAAVSNARRSFTVVTRSNISKSKIRKSFTAKSPASFKKQSHKGRRRSSIVITSDTQEIFVSPSHNTEKLLSQSQRVRLSGHTPASQPSAKEECDSSKVQESATVASGQAGAFSYRLQYYADNDAAAPAPLHQSTLSKENQEISPNKVENSPDVPNTSQGVISEKKKSLSKDDKFGRLSKGLSATPSVRGLRRTPGRPARTPSQTPRSRSVGFSGKELAAGSHYSPFRVGINRSKFPDPSRRLFATQASVPKPSPHAGKGAARDGGYVGGEASTSALGRLGTFLFKSSSKSPSPTASEVKPKELNFETEKEPSEPCSTPQSSGDMEVSGNSPEAKPSSTRSLLGSAVLTFVRRMSGNLENDDDASAAKNEVSSSPTNDDNGENKTTLQGESSSTATSPRQSEPVMSSEELRDMSASFSPSRRSGLLNKMYDAAAAMRSVMRQSGSPEEKEASSLDESGNSIEEKNESSQKSTESSEPEREIGRGLPTLSYEYSDSESSVSSLDDETDCDEDPCCIVAVDNNVSCDNQENVKEIKDSQVLEYQNSLDSPDASARAEYEVSRGQSPVDRRISFDDEDAIAGESSCDVSQDLSHEVPKEIISLQSETVQHSTQTQEVGNDYFDRLFEILGSRDYVEDEDEDYVCNDLDDLGESSASMSTDSDAFDEEDGSANAVNDSDRSSVSLDEVIDNIDDTKEIDEIFAECSSGNASSCSDVDTECEEDAPHSENTSESIAEEPHTAKAKSPVSTKSFTLEESREEENCEVPATVAMEDALQDSFESEKQVTPEIKPALRRGLCSRGKRSSMAPVATNKDKTYSVGDDGGSPLANPVSDSYDRDENIALSVSPACNSKSDGTTKNAECKGKTPDIVKKTSAVQDVDGASSSKVFSKKVLKWGSKTASKSTDVDSPSLQKFTVFKLRSLLKRQGLATGGLKKELIERLVAHKKQGSSKVTKNSEVQVSVDGGNSALEIIPSDESNAPCGNSKDDAKVNKNESAEDNNDNIMNRSDVRNPTPGKVAVCESPVMATTRSKTPRRLLRSSTKAARSRREVVPDTVAERSECEVVPDAIDISLYRQKTVKELREFLKARNLDTQPKLRKEDLIQHLIRLSIGPFGNDLKAPEMAPSKEPTVPLTATKSSSKITVAQLRVQLKERGLCQVGLKRVLIERLNRPERRGRRARGDKTACGSCREGKVCEAG